MGTNAGTEPYATVVEQAGEPTNIPTEVPTQPPAVQMRGGRQIQQ